MPVRASPCWRQPGTTMNLLRRSRCRLVVFASLALAALSALAGCFEPSEPLGGFCDTEADCTSALACRQNTCVAHDGTCAADDECPGLCSADGFCELDGFCARGERGSDCAVDEAFCGDGICQSEEVSWCQDDCAGSGGAPCGDGVCEPGELCGADCRADESVVLPVAPIPQSAQMWCWAATTEMILSYYGQPGSQCEVVSYWVGADCCPANTAPWCDVGAPSPELIQQAIALGQVGAQLVYAPLSFSQLKSEIDTGHPVVVLYSGSFGGHVVVLHGYDGAGNVYINDPFYGQFIVPYATANLYNGSSIWSHSILTSES